ncbi:enoyl-CoA hydratase/isomerase family protein [Orrella sp. NBD-18]|uniref:3-hydroxyisobutyryl-CoA hydrolase n=1 Tax=Sheuella amnicola TaxID=2707330 RepID=A0A6B2QYV5_9BURK|nr:enoyl-CoA hydratase/isomerase family protein [Sheuella amnicola]NDY81907.1 enoyl-CoA hydratase/isomerase family protein [Sheuella amnicola]
MSEINTDIVLFEELKCANSMRIGLATLNTPKTLNGLSLDMTRLLASKMESWAKDDGIAVIILRGAGEKAFCAGGDLHSLYHSMLENKGKTPVDNAYAGTFFAEEYALDYRIHTFPKPILVWGDGIVMGGGMGLMMGASHRVVTDTSKLAMPEITIGLFPDVGGTWLLNRLPGKTGLFMGLTGAHIGAADALFAGMADYHLPRSAWDGLITGLKATPWVNQKLGMDEHALRVVNDDYLNTLLHSLSTDPQPEVGPLQQHMPLIQRLCSGSDLNKIVSNLLALSTHEDPWLQRASKTLSAGSPGSARLTFTLLQRCKHVSLAEVYRIEWTAGLMCAASGDFAEGIRALLVDKDKQPKWNPPSLKEATAQWVEKFFQPAVPIEQHPLKSLGVSA